MLFRWKGRGGYKKENPFPFIALPILPELLPK